MNPENTSALLVQLFKRFQGESLAMSYTMADFRRDFSKEHFKELTPLDRQEALVSLPPGKREKLLQALLLEERREVLQALPAEELLAALSPGQIRQYLDRLTAGSPAKPDKPRRKR
jgi:hypothetical protein